MKAPLPLTRDGILLERKFAGRSPAGVQMVDEIRVSRPRGSDRCGSGEIALAPVFSFHVMCRRSRGLHQLVLGSDSHHR